MPWEAQLVLAMRIRRKTALRRTIRCGFQTVLGLSLPRSHRFLAQAARLRRDVCYKFGSPLWEEWMMKYSGIP